ncbi:protein GAMETOPHYTE DEFECTIVE 1 [Hevea brasiliensis]|uniref:protein GAMETOPHYTE DEFECTIVE 1 n=1 Tax=Hevea brasiliensis TaxID=3981 RepID=UPI0025DE675A|nr:protein GAMETOPHYTE DEFECTIVE 1 [Hevea brasiliensis]
MPFLRYTRLTVCVDTPAQCQAINSGNNILKTCELVAVRALNQTAFDHACEKYDVDIIAIDFSEKLLFRLKLPMVKSAMGRGIYYEITYSDLIVDVQVRRRMISNAKNHNIKIVHKDVIKKAQILEAYVIMGVGLRLQYFV